MDTRHGGRNADPHHPNADGKVALYFNDVLVCEDMPYNVVVVVVVDSIEMIAKNDHGARELPIELYLLLNDHLLHTDGDPHLELELEEGLRRTVTPPLCKERPTRCANCGEDLNDDDRRGCGGDTTLCRECKVEEAGGLKGFRA